MKTDWSHLEQNRIRQGHMSSEAGNHFGAFLFDKGARKLKVIATDGDVSGWEHVSLSCSIINGPYMVGTMPTWQDMCWLRDLFWNEEETVMQLHPPKSMHVNNHNHCLHLWRPTNQEIPLPPSILVGIKELGIIFK